MHNRNTVCNCLFHKVFVSEKVRNLTPFKDENLMYRFLVLPYVNALPLVHYIKEICPQAELLCRTPRWSVDALLRGSVDAALIPWLTVSPIPSCR
jgi:hypothetical protein